MSGQPTPRPPSANGTRNRPEVNRLERAVSLLFECVELLRTEIDEARTDGYEQEGGDHGEHSTGDQPAG